MGYITYNPGPLLGDMVHTAQDAAKETRGHVLTQQVAAIEKADAIRAGAASALQSLAGMAPKLTMRQAGVQALKLPDAPRPDVKLGDLRRTELPAIATIPAGQHSVGAIREIGSIAIQPFEPALTSLAIPDAPAPMAKPQFPDAPALKRVTVPDAPDLQAPRAPDILDIRLPAFDFTPLAPFQDTDPAFEPINALLQWAPTPYRPVLMDEEVAVLRRMWAGGTGLPPAVEQALWERAASREDVAIARDVSAAAVEFSARGFTLPPGAMVARVDAIRTEGALRKQALGREVLVKVADTHIENLRFACTQALAAEGVLIGLWNQADQRSLEGAKYLLDAQLAASGAAVALYNARQAARANGFAARRLELEEQQTELQQKKLELDGELARGQVNEQNVRVYTAMWQGVATQADVYRSQVQGAQAQSEVERLEVEKYKAMVQGVAESIQADKLRFDAYKSQVEGESAKAGLVESQAKAYSAYVSGKSAEADIYIKRQRGDIDREELQLRAFLGNLEVSKANLQAQLAELTATAELERTNTARYTASAQAQTTVAELQLKQWETYARTQLGVYETEMRKIIADMEQMMRAAGLQADIYKSIGQHHATMAAGAMAGVQLGASVSASAGMSAGGSASLGIQYNFKDGTEIPD